MRGPSSLCSGTSRTSVSAHRTAWLSIPTQVQLCSAPVHPLDKYNRAEERAVTAQGGRYIDVTPWFCTTRCGSIIGHYEVYLNQLHVTGTYSLFLEQVLAEKLQLNKAS